MQKISLLKNSTVSCFVPFMQSEKTFQLNSFLPFLLSGSIGLSSYTFEQSVSLRNTLSRNRLTNVHILRYTYTISFIAVIRAYILFIMHLFSKVRIQLFLSIFSEILSLTVKLKFAFLISKNINC